MKVQLGFSIVEILVAVSIVSIIVVISAVNFNDARERSRDVDRQADLRQLQSAIELYKNRYGRYPEGCNGPDNWSGQSDADTYDCPNDSSEYILNLAPEFIPALPKDPKLNGSDSGYVYTVNSAGSVYKVMARRTVESEVVTTAHPMKSCESSSLGVCTSSGLCSPSNTTVYQRSYALWGGYALGSNTTLVNLNTRAIICKQS